MKIVYLPLDAIERDPENAKDHSDAEIARLRAVIEEYGFIEPLVINTQTGFLLSGEGRLEAARLCHLDTVPCILIDLETLPAKALGLALNADYGHWDRAMRNRVVTELYINHYDLDLTGLPPWTTEKLSQDIQTAYQHSLDAAPLSIPTVEDIQPHLPPPRGKKDNPAPTSTRKRRKNEKDMTTHSDRLSLTVTCTPEQYTEILPTLEAWKKNGITIH